MDVKLPKGTYVLAVSGGVDSMVLLNILCQKPALKLVIAHFNHGIRADSTEDEKLVAKTARNYGLSFEIGYGKLGNRVSEDRARQARYKFLEAVREKYKANAIITAHHRDDYLETALINLIRGTGRRGLSAISNNQQILRPMLDYSKEEVLGYAKKHAVKWREDPTNSDASYLRNYIRLKLIPKLTVENKRDLLKNIEKVANTHRETENIIATISQNVINNKHIDRSKFALLPHEVSREILACWLRDQKLTAFDQNSLERLTVAIKTASAGTEHDIYGGKKLIISRRTASLGA